jgi:chaperonin cofactor prefoldin
MSATTTAIPAYRPSASTETTTVRSAIIKQIAVLQKQEAKLGEELAKLTGNLSTGQIQQKIALMQQIQSIEDQISALQTALLQKEADRQVTVTSAGNKAPAKESAAAEPQKEAATIGTVIDTVA